MPFLIKYTFPFLLLLVLTNCTAQNKDIDAVYKVSYLAQTRGSAINIDFKDSTLVFKSNTDDKSMVLSEVQVSTINNAVSKIKLSEIANLTAPSNKRFSDGALAASFTINKNNTSYSSIEFDHGNPPKELKDLYLLLEKYSK